ncbi:MAG TPA: aminopeptidase [Selenomonadales bacterium]|nr:aminopeptidase [Selenomonadales bacterium]
MEEKLARSAEIAIRDCMGVKPGENVLIVTDGPKREIGRALWQQAIEAGADAVYMEMTPRKTHGTEPPAMVAEAMKKADVVLGPTSKSFSHTAARKAANKAGARIATLPDITEDMMKRTLCADYKKIGAVSERFAQILNDGKQVHLTTQAGTELTMSIAGREAHPDTGLNHTPGSFSNLPAGEAYIAPLEDTAEGLLVVDGAMAGIGVLSAPIKMTVEKGYVTRVEGGPEASQLEGMLAEYGKPARNIAELGIGTNDMAIITGKILEDEKVLGTVHVALGNSVSFGGKVDVPIHLDGILNAPTLTVDGRVIIKDGKHLI